MSSSFSIEDQNENPVASLEELIEVETNSIGVSTLAGKYQNDPTLRDICSEAYQFRDAEGSGLQRKS